jgi:hypothetical protein
MRADGLIAALVTPLLLSAHFAGEHRGSRAAPQLRPGRPGHLPDECAELDDNEDHAQYDAVKLPSRNKGEHHRDLQGYTRISQLPRHTSSAALRT